MSDENTSISFLKEQVAEFVHDRDWEQFHNPKDLAVSISIEAAELLERFQWKSEEEINELIRDDEGFREIKEEVADIFIYLLSLANKLDLDLSQAVMEKLEKNRKKYPVEKAKGKADKYTNYLGGD